MAELTVKSSEVPSIKTRIETRKEEGDENKKRKKFGSSFH